MRALSVRGPRDAAIVEVADPSPGPGEVLVRIRACGVCGSDLNAWRGVAGIEYPLPPGAPGHETRGEVVALGHGVDSFRVGQVVTGLMWKGFADLGVGRAEDLVAVPSGFTHTTLLGEPLACAMNVVRRAGLVAADRASSLGADDRATSAAAAGRLAIVGFGYLAALIASLLPDDLGAWVAVSRRPDSRALALRLGASAAYDFGEIPSGLWDTFPVVIESAGVQQTLDYATWLVAYGGRLVIAGYHADGPRTVNMQTWNWKGIDVINAHEREPARYVAALQAALVLLQTRPIDLAVLHTHEWPLHGVAEAFRVADERRAGFVKGIICP
jgi:NADPH2:quinone reductase